MYHLRGKEAKSSVKFFHLADLHIGKNVNGFSMLRDQRHVLEQVLAAAERERPEALLLAGDIYDRPVPAGEAVALLDWFLTELAALNLPCLAVAGNHDSGVRLSFAGQLLRRNGVYLAGTVQEELLHVPFHRDGVTAVVWLLPFLRPAEVAALFPEEEVHSYDDAVRVVLAHQKLQPNRCNLLVAHQFVTQGGREPERSDSEAISVGGVDNVDSAVFAGFDYVALGHLHGPQSVGEHCHYAGSPLQYSFSELHHRKGITVVQVEDGKQITLSRIPLEPLHPLREIQGPLEALLKGEIVAQGDPEDYLHVTLTDELEPENAQTRLRAVYPNLMKLDFDNSRTRQEELRLRTDTEEKMPSLEELFAEFYQRQNGRELDEQSKALVGETLDAEGGEML